MNPPFRGKLCLLAMFVRREPDTEIFMKTEHSKLRTIVNQDGAVILSSPAGTITRLNSTGAFVWQALERGQDPITIAQDLSRETDKPVETLLPDIWEFIQALKDRGLLAG